MKICFIINVLYIKRTVNHSLRASALISGKELRFNHDRTGYFLMYYHSYHTALASLPCCTAWLRLRGCLKAQLAIDTKIIIYKIIVAFLLIFITIIFIHILFFF